LNLLGLGGLDALEDAFFVFIRHFPVRFSDHATRVVIILGDLSEHLDEGRNLDLLFVFLRLNSEHGGLSIDIQESLHNEVLHLMNEALSELLEFFVAPGLLLTHLDVLTCRDLAPLLDPLLLLVSALFVNVGKTIIFACFPHEILGGRRLGEEILCDVKHLFFYFIWCLDVELPGQHNQQELFVVALLGR